MQQIAASETNSSSYQHWSGGKSSVFERIIASNTTDLVCIHAADRSIVFCTESVTDLLGYSVDQITGRDLFDFLSDEFREDMNEALLSRMLYRDGMQVKVMLRKSDGNPIWLKTSWTDGSRIEGLPDGLSISVSSDITESVSLMEDLIEAWSQEKEINQLRSNLFSIASHEFKTPLAVIQMQLDVLCEWVKRDELDKRYNNVIGKLQNQLERFNTMISDILRLRKMNSGQEPFNPKMVDLKRIIKGEKEQLLEKYPKRKIKVVEQYGSKQVCADERMIGYIISNLLGNALKYSAQEKEVLVELKFDEEGVLLIVKDKGIGIPKQEVHRIFQPFYRAENARNIEGTGVALSIIKQFVVMHQGEIHIESEVNEGTSFIIRMPYDARRKV
jgi:PAS domain S-box-containing protein